jgi:hypothetical protein
VLFAGRRRDRPAREQRSEPSEHTDQDGRRTPHTGSLHRGGGLADPVSRATRACCAPLRRARTYIAPPRARSSESRLRSSPPSSAATRR